MVAKVAENDLGLLAIPRNTLAELPGGFRESRTRADVPDRGAAPGHGSATPPHGQRAGDPGDRRGDGRRAGGCGRDDGPGFRRRYEDHALSWAADARRRGAGLLPVQRRMGRGGRNASSISSKRRTVKRLLPRTLSPGPTRPTPCSSIPRRTRVLSRCSRSSVASGREEPPACPYKRAWSPAGRSPRRSGDQVLGAGRPEAGEMLDEIVC